VPENVSIAYRGVNYAIGQGPQFYGIWHAASPQAAPLEWWPLTPDGWTGAWTRFASIEVPGTITAVTQAPAAAPAAPAPPVATTVPPAATTAATPASAAVASEPVGNRARATVPARVGAALLGLGIVLGIVSLFPTYIDGTSLASQSFQVVPHIIYLAGWTLSAILILLGGMKLRVGALLGLGVSAVTFGLFFADAGTPMAGGAHLMGAGLVLGVLGWFACAAGVGAGFAAGLSVKAGLTGGAIRPTGPYGRTSRVSSHEIVPTITMILAAIGAAIAFAPSWDRFVLRTAVGVSQRITEGNAFSNPASVIIGDVLVMVALVAVIVVAALWRPSRLGAALAAGAIIPMAAQAISAGLQLSSATSPAQFGLSQAQATQLGLTIHAGVTAMFWVYCAFLATLALLCLWMLLTSNTQATAQAGPYAAGRYWTPTAGQAQAGQANQAGPVGPADAMATTGTPADSTQTQLVGQAGAGPATETAAVPPQ
jgi:hypothetical protein